MLVKRVDRDDEWIKNTEQEVIKFNQEIEDAITRLNNIKFE